MGQACSSTGLSPPGLRCLLRGVGGRPLVGSAPDRRRESGPGRTGKASVRSDLGGAGDSAHQFKGAKLTPQAFPRGLRVRRWAVHRITRLGFISAFCLADVSTKVISISSFNFQKSGIPSSEHHGSDLTNVPVFFRNYPDWGPGALCTFPGIALLVNEFETPPK